MVSWRKLRSCQQSAFTKDSETLTPAETHFASGRDPLAKRHARKTDQDDKGQCWRPGIVSAKNDANQPSNTACQHSGATISLGGTVTRQLQ
jgi:hypothetical protein